MDTEIDSDIRLHLYNFPEGNSSIKSYVKDFSEPMASLVYRYKAALSFTEIELGGIIGYDSSKEIFENLEKVLEPLINYCAKLAKPTIKEMSAPEN